MRGPNSQGTLMRQPHEPPSRLTPRCTFLCSSGLISMLLVLPGPWRDDQVTGLSSPQSRPVGLAAPQGPVISVRPGQDIQALVAASPAGSTFLLRAGVHRMQSIRPRNGDTFR